MQGNDLANVVVPRDVLVFEGLLGVFIDHTARNRFEKFRDRGKWAKALACFTTNEIMARQIWHLTWNYNVEIDLLTYQGEGFRKALAQRVEEEGLPIHEVIFEEPQVFARSLVYRPDIRSVYDPYPEHQFLFGGKTRVISADQATQFGLL